jgi:hypothetical protein
LLQGDKIARIAAFPAAVAFEAPRYVNFSDCNAVYEPNTGLMSRLHSRLGQPLPPMKAVCSLHADHCYRFPHNVRNLLWTDPALLGKPAEEGSFEYPDTAWIITKHDVQGSLFAFAAKGGHNNEPHNHNDLGHFIVYAGGEAQLTDLGAGVYTRDYFREGRYTYLHNGSEGHSVPLINGKPQAAGRGYKAVVLENVQHKEQLTYKLDLTAAYPADSGLQSFIRSFEWTCSVGGIEARLRLTDDFAFSGESNDVTETFVSLQPPELEKGRIRWAGEKAEVNLHYNAGLLEANLDVIPTQDHQKNSITVYRIRLVASGLGAAAAIPIEIVCTRTLT